ncbi:Zn-ribbon domain-containing OB-fold protein [Paracandidimonas soli]|uniref:ChsH2 C-terminal OB-fold domain-containing protein n=1 Tax=Paracandidimonas soli TaxID=1917182 RepID=A0A4R3UYB8_9BURK|nr:OB-fold domain-containing protein [Paracandidimonas soli]TCU96081.1 hypothetical protein EV686_107139 [Paracandidimonas soli]
MSNKAPLIITDTSRPFWEAIARRELLLQYDAGADRYQFYPRPISLHTTEQLQWRKASGYGVLIAATRTHFAAAGFADRIPYWEGLIKLDEGPRIFAPLGGAGEDGWQLGMRMRIAWPEKNGEDHPFWFEAASGPA